jgi:hypothetical protein
VFSNFLTKGGGGDCQQGSNHCHIGAKSGWFCSGTLYDNVGL